MSGIAIFMVLFSFPFLGVGLYLAYLGGKRLHTANRIWLSNPTTVSKAAEYSDADAFTGTVEAFEDEEPFKAPLSGEQVVLSTFKTEKYSGEGTDSGSNWSETASSEIRQPFLVSDETGTVILDPEGADISFANKSEQMTVEAPDSLPNGVRLRLSVMTDKFDLDSVLAQNTGRRRYTEEYIAPGDDIYVYGTEVTEQLPRESVADARLAKSEVSPLYKISTGDKSTILKEHLMMGVFWVFFSLWFAVPGLFTLVVALMQLA